MNNDGENNLTLNTQNLKLPTETYNTGRIFPIYSELNGISPGWFAQKMRLVLDNVDTIFHEYLPDELIQKFWLPSVAETIRAMHYPESFEQQKRANMRIFFDRLLRVQLYSLMNRQHYQQEKQGFIWEEIMRDIVKEIIEKLPFTLTNAQKKVIKMVTENIHEPKPMLRLLQWDVGSGKTVVAATSAYYTHKKFGGQSVFMAPLEVLAQQHYRTLAKLLMPLGLRVELLTGSVTKDQKTKIKKDLQAGHIHVLVWTHAVLQEDVQFQNLQFVVIDEQHKFGVKQRAFFKQFGAPHILQMSATPIPRSMALAFFWEFDVSVIDEMPVGRLPIKTKIISASEYTKLKPWILDRVNKWEKVFIVTPLIEESEKMEELKSAVKEFEETRRLFGDYGDWHVWSEENEQQKNERNNDKETEKIIGIAMKIHRELWPRLREVVYQNALEKLLKKEWFTVEKEKEIKYKIEWETVGTGFMDIVVNKKIAIELKSKPEILPVDYKQLRWYTTQDKGIRTWLLFNFWWNSLDFRRIEKQQDMSTSVYNAKEISKSPLNLQISPKVGLLHGKLKPKEKEKVMEDFKTGKINILVSTTVIEVGIDIPEATIMVIKNAERFWLSQLHQLRGRIGRSDVQSYCFLETKSKSGDIGKRLKAMEDTNDGFKLAELDLQNRGAGEILWTMQSGESDIPLEILSDLKFLEKIQDAAKWILEKYPDLHWLPGLKKYLEEKMWDVLA